MRISSSSSSSSSSSASSRISFFFATAILVAFQIFAFNTILLADAQDATNDTTIMEAGTDDEEEKDPTWKSLLKLCPIKIAKLSPCIDSDSDLSQCTNCVTEFVSDNNILSDGGENENNNDDSNNATTTTAFCNNIQTEVCRGVATCGDSCGLITSNGENGKVASFLQFGSSCETLFLDLVICALESQNIGEDCSMETCAANGTAIGSSSIAPSLSLSAVITVAWVTAVTSISFF